MVLQAASDWALRRLLKVLLKKSLKHVFATELDVEQLRVSLGTGALELTDVLLSPEWLAEQAPPGLQVVSGYIGRLALSLAVTSLTCAVQLDDVLLTVRPDASGGAGAPAAPAISADGAADAGPFAVGGGKDGAAGPGIDDGVRLVAAGVETLLQRMTVTLNSLSVRIEGAEGGSSGIASLSCTQISYGAAAVGPDVEDSHAASTARRVVFSGLSLAVREGAPPLLAPLGGEVDVTVVWPLERAPGHLPHVSVAARLEPLQVQLRPPDVVAMAALARSYSAAATQAHEQQQQQQLLHAPKAGGGEALPALPPALPPSAKPLQPGRQLSAAAVAGHRSFLEDLMLPGCSEGLVADAFLEGSTSGAAAASITGQEEVDEFFDAKSLLGSLQEAFSSAMSASGSHWGPGGWGAASSAPGAAGAAAPLPDLDAFAMRDLAAGIREVGAVQQKQWSVSLAVPALSLSLLYPEEAGCGSPHFAPRLVAEVAELVVHAESGSPNSSSGCLSASVGVVELAEHLAFPASPASSAASLPLGASGWLPAEEMARVPALLPAAQHIQWAAPTSAGDYPLPDEASSLGGIGDTLAQLSGLSQATTVYQSAAAGLEGSIMMQSMLCQDAAVLPRVQIVPVLRCGGGSQSGAALALLCTSLPAEKEAGKGGSAASGADVSLLLQPVSVWCALPLLAHLQSFVAPLAEQLAADEAGPQQDNISSNGAKAAVSAAIGDILQQQQQQQGPTSALRLSLYLPAACLVVTVPSPDPALPKYFAADVRGSSSELLLSMAPRLGSQPAKALLASLSSSGVQPTIVLEQGGAAAASGSSWACAIRTGSAAVHAVREADGQAALGESVLGPALAAMQVACIEGGSPRASGGLSIDICWRQVAAAAPDLLDHIWAAAGQDSGCQPEQASLQEQLSAGSSLLVTVSASAPLQLAVEQPVVAAASRLADALLQLSAAPPPAGAATQATLLLGCDVHCTLSVPQSAPFSLTARSLRVVACSSIAGVAGSSAVAASVGSLELARPEAGEGTRLLALAAGQQLGDRRRKPALQVIAPLRPTGEPCMLCSNGRYVLPSRARVSVATAGLTVLLDESGQVDWVADLQATFSAPAATNGSGLAANGAALADPTATSLPPQPAPALEWGLCLAASSVRYEPKDTHATAAVLTIASISCQSGEGQQQGSIEARRLALHIGAAGGGSISASASPARGRSSFQGSSPAELPGFHQVASETGITMQLPTQQQQAAEQQLAGEQQAMQETAVTNRGLSITLSRHTLLLLQGLVQQLPSSRSSHAGSSGGEGEQPAGGALTPEHSVGSVGREGSLAASTGSEGLGRPAVDVMRGVVQGAYASPSRPAEHAMEASVFLDGGWYDPQDGAGGRGGNYVMSPAGSPPAMVESFMEEAGRPAAVAQEGQGVWYGGEAAVEVQEDYAALQEPSEEEVATCFGSPGYDCRMLPPDHPPPASRLSLRDLSITITLADTFTTILLPEDDADWGDGLGEAPGSPQRRRSSSSSGAAQVARGDGAAEEEQEEEEVVPLSAQVQARLEGLCLQLDTFTAAAVGEATSSSSDEGGAAMQMRCALRLRHLEVRDSFQPRQGSSGGGAAGAAAAAATGWADLRRMLGYHASAHRARGAGAAMVQVVVEAIAAEPGAEPEYRLQVQVLPLLLYLDQAALAFLQHFFAPAEAEGQGAAAVAGGSQIPAQAGAAAPQPTVEPYFQRCEVQPFMLTIHYRSHRVDLAALSSGQVAEVFNLVPWGGVSLQFRHLRLFGMQGLGGIGTAVASAYVEDIARHQAHRFVSGIAPIQSICRVSSAAAQLLAIPRQQLYRRANEDGCGGGLTLAALTDANFRRQMQRGLAGLVRAVALEACNLGATVAAGAEVALGGEASASHTAGVKAALRQASAHLRSTTSGGGPRSTANAAATAVRTALLGVRNSLDRQRALERRLNS